MNTGPSAPPISTRNTTATPGDNSPRDSADRAGRPAPDARTRPAEPVAVPEERPDRRTGSPEGPGVETRRPEAAPAVPPGAGLRTMVAERKNVSVLIVRAQLSPDRADIDPETIDEAVESMAATIREDVKCLGGTVAASIGSVWLALFGVPRAAEDDAERAVHAALSIRDRLSMVPGPADPCLPGRGADVQVAVVTGEALVRYQPGPGGIPPSVNGTLVDDCHTLLSLTPAGEIRVCDSTRRITEPAITYHRAGSGPDWRVGGLPAPPPSTAPRPCRASRRAPAPWTRPASSGWWRPCATPTTNAGPRPRCSWRPRARSTAS
ncbi:hypothetical protein [Streptomyces sp. NPDC046727]|uniref:hypothetical protein n=1 Tax=Streptomyces sp. NPDC046727 TaxID=3155373 RepID=UPI003401CE6B